MRKINVHDLSLATNVCGQMLREVGGARDWSMAHVLMNPRASSLLHRHNKMSEVYIITRGQGKLFIDNDILQVQAGNTILIEPGQLHKLENIGIVSLEHLVIASPPFDPTDVFTINDEFEPYRQEYDAVLPAAQDCFDGAKIFPYAFPQINTSIAFGWVMNDSNRHKPAHYHNVTDEFAYVVEGQGVIEVNGTSISIKKGDWMQIYRGEYHTFRNTNDQHMVVVCICIPMFDMNDVYYE